MSYRVECQKESIMALKCIGRVMNEAKDGAR